MGLKRAESQLQILLADTIWAMCKNTLQFKGGIRVEGLIGVTIDEEEIFLIPVNQKISKEVPNEVAIVEAEQSSLPVEYRVERISSSSSNSCSDSSESDTGDSNHPKERKNGSRRKRKRKRRSVEAGNAIDVRMGIQSGAKRYQPVPGRSYHYNAGPSTGSHGTLDLSSRHSSPVVKGAMVIKPEAIEQDVDESQDESEDTFFVVKSEFGGKRLGERPSRWPDTASTSHPEAGRDDEESQGDPKDSSFVVKSEFGEKKLGEIPLPHNSNRWPDSGSTPQQQPHHSPREGSFQNSLYATEVGGSQASAILQHLSSIQSMTGMQYPAHAPIPVCTQSPQHFMSPSRSHSLDGHSQISSSQSPVAQHSGDHGDGFHLTRKRTSFSPRQISALEQAFSQHGHYMNAQDRAVFARKIGLTEKVVTIWFQNRRQKLKKSEQDPQVNPYQDLWPQSGLDINGCPVARGNQVSASGNQNIFCGSPEEQPDRSKNN